MNGLTFVLALTVVAGLLGCNQPSAAPPNKAAKGDGHVHEHGDEAHEHSAEGHVHGIGPHGGTIADWGGGKFHVELTVEHTKQQATVYILGSDEKTPTPIDAKSIELSIQDPEMQVSLQASPQDGDPLGKSSRFSGTSEKLGVAQEYTGTVTGVVDATPYSGEFNEDAQGEDSKAR